MSGTGSRDGLVLGIDIGGTDTSAALVTADHRIIGRRRAPTPAPQGPEAVVACAVSLARELLTAAGGVRVGAVGVGTAGVVARDGRTVAHATEALAGWAGTPVAGRLEEALDGRPVSVLGDVQAFLVGEAVAGRAVGARCAAGVMAGTGIGGAVWVAGRLLRGAGGAAGHLGHVTVPGAEGERCPCGRTGHVEAVASGPAMAARHRRAHPDRAVTDLRSLAALARSGDEEARATLGRGGSALGTALGGVVSILDPDIVVLGGGVLNSGPWYTDALRRSLAAAALPACAGVRVARAALGADAVLVGAAHTARARAGGGRPTGRGTGTAAAEGRVAS